MYLSLPERTKYVEGSAPRGLRRDTDKNPASHAIRGDGGSVPESPRRGGEDPKHTHMWLTLIITHTHTAQEDVERFTAHITRLSVGNRAASPTSSLLGTRPRNGLGDSGGRGLAKGSEARAGPHGLRLLWLMPRAGASFLETEEAGVGLGSKDVPVKHQKQVRLFIHLASATHGFHSCFECPHQGQKRR